MEATQTTSRDVFQHLADIADSDILLYNAPIERPYDTKLIRMCATRRRRKNLLVVLVTEGGDPDAAYRISRCLQRSYDKVTCFVSGYCKSAGTLVALGAHELVFSDNGELGPIDVQMSKKDELWESESGLTVAAALISLHERAFTAFQHFFMQSKVSGGSITLRTATDIAAKLTTGLYAPIFEQIDPLHVGEAHRAIKIASQYGARLATYGKNLRRDNLERLISGYTSHSFVIDREEAAKLFNSVRQPSEAEVAIEQELGDRAAMPLPGCVEFLTSEPEPEETTKESSNVGQPKDGQEATEEFRTGAIAAVAG